MVELIMIDMMYLTNQLTKTEYNNCFNSLQKYLKENYPKQQLHRENGDEKVYITYALSEFGFQEIRLYKNKYDYRSIEVRFRPQLLINREGHYNLTSILDLISIEKEFNQFLRHKLDLLVNDFKDWRAKRVEAAIDIHVDESLIPIYILLFKRGNIPEYFFKNKQTKKYEKSLTNLYLMAKSITINWYDRYQTLQIKEKKSDKRFKDYTETRGILRFETQLRNCEKRIEDLLDEDKLKHKVMKFYNLIVGRGDYYSMDKAIEIINDSVGNPGKRLALIRILRLIDECGSISKAKNKYSKGQDAKKMADKFSKRINELRKLGINPVILPQEWGITHLQNLYGILEKS